MNILWSYFWPVFAAGLLAGAIAGSIAFRRSRRPTIIAAGVAASLAAAAIWHGPLGAADRLESAVDRDARDVLDFYEMKEVQGILHQDPLSRRLVLTGPADDFQRRELVRIMGHLPGVREASWSGRGGLPLIAEAAIASLVGFLVGAMLAYLIELRRRYNAQWKW